MNNSVILFCCHYLSPEIEREFIRLKSCCGKDYDVVLSLDCSKDPERMARDFSSHLFTTDQIKKMGYGFKEHEGIWYHPEYPILDYYSRKPQYDFYWRIEYDVRFGGDWGVFFRHFLDNKADLLGPYIRAYKDDPGWRWWKKINFNVDQKYLCGMLFPVVRFSRSALALLDQKYRAGVSGYSEVIVPTLLNMERMSVEDIGKRFYDLFTLNFRGIVIKKRGKLHHPVKKIKYVTRLRTTFNSLTRRRLWP
jgi:hypothetical protein